ncbi:hypothetical protein [Hahella sp. HN01]|uniref:hypothetical protein n=1 Tax=Hahella sp. HN01 TaxID=2847262 RepID=UPI001C1F0C38|nr:hypothetical protein [Hahella sp. HN01]MBU6955032.1 hypothetical protein [Hahella sp. HN01]
MAEQYQTSKQNAGKHVEAVLADGELAEEAVVNSKFTTAAEYERFAEHGRLLKEQAGENDPSERLNWTPPKQQG